LTFFSLALFFLGVLGDFAPGVLANEWASEVAVKPIARLTVAPDDFPFLSQVQVHDDGEFVRLGEVSDAVYEAVVSATESSEGFVLELDWHEEVSQQVLTYINLQREFTPTITMTLSFEPNYGPVRLRIQGPTAFEQVLRDHLREHLSQV